VLAGFRGVKDAGGTVSDIIAARFRAGRGRDGGRRRPSGRWAAVRYGYPPGAVAVLVIELYGPQVMATTLARMGEPMPVTRIAQVLDAPGQGVPVACHLADTLDGPGRRVWHSIRTAISTR
jgi:hypothetical protein